MQREQQKREVLVKESEVQEYMTISDASDNSILEVLDNQAQLHIPAPSSSQSQSSNLAKHQHLFIQKGSTEPPQKQQRIANFWAYPSASSVSQRPTGFRMTDAPRKSVSGPSTPPDARNHDESSSRKREKSQVPEAPRQPLMEFLRECKPPMKQWYGPLVTFGCDNLLFVEALARWDDENLKAGLRLIKDQPGIDEKLEEIDVVFLIRNLRKRLQTKAALD
jgi:hypothetical protein